MAECGRAGLLAENGHFVDGHCSLSLLLIPLVLNSGKISGSYFQTRHLNFLSSSTPVHPNKSQNMFFTATIFQFPSAEKAFLHQAN